MMVTVSDTGVCFTFRLFNNLFVKHFFKSAALAEACALLNAILVVNVI